MPPPCTAFAAFRRSDKQMHARGHTPRMSALPKGSVTILANPDCPHCVQAVDHLTDWAMEVGLPICAVDLKKHPEVAEAWDCEHSPLVVFQRRDGEDAAPGPLTHQEFLRLARQA